MENVIFKKRAAFSALCLSLAACGFCVRSAMAEDTESAPATQAAATTGAMDMAAETAADATVEGADAADAVPNAAAAEAASAALGAEQVTHDAQSQNQPGTDPGTKKTYDFISDGTRIEVKDKDFTIIPPRGWEVYTSQPNLTLLMQIPYEEGLKYQRTIQVAAFSGPRFIDEVTAKEYEEIIVRKFTEASPAVFGYRIRNHKTVEMADGRPGILFYSEFTIDSVPLMQAHILVSSTDYHYLLTYTDIAQHFEDEQANQFLTEAWDSMTSVQLAGRTPARFEAVAVVAGAAVAFVVFGLLIWGLRHQRAGRKYRDYSSGGGLDDVDLSTGHSATGVSMADSMVEPGNVESSVATGVSRLPTRSEAASKFTSKAKSTGYNAGDDADFDDDSQFDDDEDLAV